MFRNEDVVSKKKRTRDSREINSIEREAFLEWQSTYAKFGAKS